MESSAKNQAAIQLLGAPTQQPTMIPASGNIAPKLLASSVTPQEHDCLCSKDKTHSSHPGNKIFRARIDAMKEIYRKTKNKQGKMEITKDIVRYLKEKHNSRFLKRDGSGAWIEISDQAARDKVSHALRFATRRDSKKNDRPPVTAGMVAVAPPTQQQQQAPQPQKFSVEESAAALWQSTGSMLQPVGTQKTAPTIDSRSILQRHSAEAAAAYAPLTAASASPQAAAPSGPAGPATTTATLPTSPPSGPTAAASAGNASSPYCGVIPEEHIEPSKWLLALRQGS